MADELYVDPAEPRRASVHVQALADDVNGALRRLEARLDALGSETGTDEPAEAYRQTYEPVKEKLLKAARELATYLDGMADRVVTSMDMYERAEDEATRRVARGG